jgi:DNA invertase Pin-like site-specific DNA recombinase
MRDLSPVMSHGVPSMLLPKPTPFRRSAPRSRSWLHLIGSLAARHFLQMIDELDSLRTEFVSRRENIDSAGPLRRLLMTLISSIAELELDLFRERVRAGMRRARLEGRRLQPPESVP